MSNPSVENAPNTKKERPVWLHILLVFVGLAVGATLYYSMPEAMGEAPRRMAAIFGLSLVLWVTEAIPLFATSLLVITLQAWWVAIPEGEVVHYSYKFVFNSLSHPVIILFLGGFILAKAVQKERIDQQMAGLMLHAFGRRPWAVLAGIMAITAIFSMWMSNTATTAMMIVLVQPFVMQIPKRDRFRRALVLAVPFAANIGGIGTPIGTPPNAIAIAVLAERGLSISFLQWMTFAMPLMLGALLVMWFFLLMLFRPKEKSFDIRIESEFKLTPKAGIVYGTFAVTVLLWLTGSLHGVPSAVVAVLPAAVLTVTHIINKEDFDQLEWNILVLMAGGIALGSGMTQTGLDQWIVNLVPPSLPFYSLAATFGIASVLLGTVVSHTVATNILLPLALAMATGLSASNQQMQVIAVMCAIMASFAMSLPISTPPNAIAYGTGDVRTKDMILVGGTTSLAAAILVVLTGPFVVTHILALFQ